MQMNASKKNPTVQVYFPNLDTLRFFAFFMVFLAHTFFTLDPLIKESELFTTLSFLSQKGILGVNLFFVLSGFLITYLLLAEQQVNGKINLKWFYIRRTLRIWPLYFLLVFLSFGAIPFVKQFFTGKLEFPENNFWLFLTFLSNFDKVPENASTSPLLGLLWSVAIEEQFYLFWPLLFILLGAIRQKWIFPILLAIHFGFMLVNRQQVSQLYHHTLMAVCDLTIGGASAYLAFHNRRFLAFWENLSKSLIIAGYVVGIAALLCYSLFYANDFLAVARRPIYALFFSFVILEQNFSKHSVFKLERLKRLKDWGKYTYAMYCIHLLPINVAIFMIGPRLPYHAPFLNWLVVFPILSFVVTLILSMLSYKYFENPFLKLKSRFSYVTKPTE
jgi:peptidoglycan/LPS O-acetylase OafA/YrhL